MYHNVPDYDLYTYRTRTYMFQYHLRNKTGGKSANSCVDFVSNIKFAVFVKHFIQETLI